MQINIKEFLLKPTTIFVMYVFVALVASLQLVLLGTHIKDGNLVSNYNNFLIFKDSFFHLIAGKNLYIHYPAEYMDLFKYSPTFALLMAFFAYLPDVVGLTLWGILNAMVLYFGIRMLPFKNKSQTILLWFVLLELLTSLQNAQSNGLMVGLMIAAYGCIQRGKISLAVLWLVLATFIKIYGCIGFVLFLFYPDKIKQLLYTLMWTAVFLVIPIVVMPLKTLVWQYQNWAIMISADETASYGMSVMGFLHSWFGVNGYKNVVYFTGLILLLLPLLRWKLYSNETFRLLFLASILIWVIIFNFKAESPTYIIAVAGVGIRHFTIKRDKWQQILLGFIFIFTCMAPTDFFPSFIRRNYFVPYVVKAIPCIMVWCIIFTELMFMKNKTNEVVGV